MRREDRKRVVIKGAGDLASGIALRLFRCGFDLVMTETAVPTTVRRTVAFSPAVYQGTVQVEDVTGVRCDSMEVVEQTLKERKIAVVVDEKAEIIQKWKPDVVVDAILAKRNLGTSIQDAPLVIAVGPGFIAGKDCHCVVESKRGHYLGRCIWEGSAIPNTGVPGLIGGYGLERLIRASDDGVFRGTVSIGSQVKAGAVVGYAGETPIHAQIDGVVRGLLQDGVLVTKGMKAGDVDPRCAPEHCDTASDKAMAIGGGVLEAILSWEQRAMALEGRTAPEQDRSASKIALVLLAAGDSRRFGSNKLLADIEGKPMYRHILEEVERLPKDAFCRRILVSQYPEILTDGERSGFRAVENQPWHFPFHPSGTGGPGGRRGGRGLLCRLRPALADPYGHRRAPEGLAGERQRAGDPVLPGQGWEPGCLFQGLFWRPGGPFGRPGRAEDPAGPPGGRVPV